jgi:hypothetical protein
VRIIAERSYLADLPLDVVDATQVATLLAGHFPHYAPRIQSLPQRARFTKEDLLEPAFEVYRLGDLAMYYALLIERIRSERKRPTDVLVVTRSHFATGQFAQACYGIEKC